MKKFKKVWITHRHSNVMGDIFHVFKSKKVALEDVKYSDHKKPFRLLGCYELKEEK